MSSNKDPQHSGSLYSLGHPIEAQFGLLGSGRWILRRLVTSEKETEKLKSHTKGVRNIIGDLFSDLLANLLDMLLEVLCAKIR
jgi:hypothetical protein